MKVCIVSAVFPPEPVTSAFTSEDVAHEMAARGHRVTVFAPFPNRPGGSIFANYRRSWRTTERRDSYDVVHSWHSLSDQSTLSSRALENLTFGVTSSWQLVLEDRPDVVYLNTWPVLAQTFSILVCRLRRIPVVCSVQDVYPESLSGKGGASANHILREAVTYLDAHNLRQCDYLTTLSNGMRDYLIETRRVLPERIQCFPNWADMDMYTRAAGQGAAFRRKHNIGALEFVVMFAGSVTHSAGLDVYLDAAELIRDVRGISLVVVGDGSQRVRIEAEIADRRLSNIRVIHPLRPKDVPGTQDAADVLVMSLAGEAAQNAVPSKLVSYLMSGKPVIGNVTSDSEAARIISTAECGVVLPTGNAESLAQQLSALAKDRAPLRLYGENARAYAARHFDRTSVLPRLADLIEAAAVRSCRV